MSFLIKMENITKQYVLGEQTYTALKGIDFQLMRGDMAAIVGTSGSGKSTLMNIMGFLDKPTTGNYWFNQQEISHFSDADLAAVRNRHIGFVFQSFFLLTRADALENVMLPLFYRGVAREQAKLLAMTMLEKVGVAHLAHHKPNQLSGGQQQRVAIARALVGDPELILADEPTGALDSHTSTEVMNLLLSLNRQDGRTIVIITHDKEVSRCCEKRILIKDGCIYPETGMPL